MSYATGNVNEVYVRLNRSFGINDQETFGSITGKKLSVETPSTENPSDNYTLNYCIDFSSDNGSTPFAQGDVIKLTSSSSYDVSDWPKVYNEN